MTDKVIILRQSEAGDKAYEVIGSQEAAKLLGMSLPVFQTYLSRGVFKFTEFKIKMFRFFNIEEVKKYAEKRKNKKEKEIQG